MKTTHLRSRRARGPRTPIHRAVLALVVLAAAPAACTPLPPALRGTARSVPRHCGPAEADLPSSPLAGAAIKVLCAGDAATPVLAGTADGRGHFELAPTQPIPYACRVELAREGYLTRSYPVEELCAAPHFEPNGLRPSPAPTACDTVVITARLVPTAGGTP